MTIIFWHEPAVWKAKCGFDCLEKRAGVMVDWAKWKAGGFGYCIHWKKAFCTDRFQISQNHSTLRLPPQILHPLNDRLSAAALMQEGRFIESDAYFSYGLNTDWSIERIKWGAYTIWYKQEPWWAPDIKICTPRTIIWTRFQEFP